MSRGVAARGAIDAREQRHAGSWAIGSATVRSRKRRKGVAEGEPDVAFVWIGHRVHGRWTIALEYTRAWTSLLTHAPKAVSRGAPKAPIAPLRAGARSLELSESADPGAAQLSLPFGTGQTWIFNGPHNGAAEASRPWNAIDFGAFDSAYRGTDVVLAARAGTVTQNNCYMVRIDHGDGWATAYWHIHVTAPLGPVARGAVVGTFFRPNPPYIRSGPCRQ